DRLLKISDMTKEIPAALLGQSKLEVDPRDRGHGLKKILGRFGEVVDLLLCPSDAARSEPALAVEVGEDINPRRRRRRVARSRSAIGESAPRCRSRIPMMSLTVRGGGTNCAFVMAAEACLASSTDMVLWHAEARRPRRSVSARLMHEISRLAGCTMARASLS